MSSIFTHNTHLEYGTQTADRIMEAIATCVDVDVPDSYLVAVAEREFQEKLLTMVGGCLLSCVFVVFLTAMPSVAPALCGRGCRRTCCGRSCLLLPVLLKIVYLPLLSAWQARSHTHTHTHNRANLLPPRSRATLRPPRRWRRSRPRRGLWTSSRTSEQGFI